MIKLPVTSYQLPVTSYQLPVTSYQLPVTSYPSKLLLLCLLLFSLFSCQPPVNKLNAPNQDAGVNEPFTPGPSGGSPSSGDDGTLVLSLNSLEGTANAVGFSIVGVGSDVSSVKVFKDGICRIFAGHSVPVGGVASGRLNNLAVGVHNFYFVTERASGPSTCRSFSASYRRKPVAPISLSAAARGTDSTPPVMVWGGVQGDRVMLYGDSICSALLGSAVASGSSARVISRGLSVGQHRFYAKRERNGVASDCSMAYASYELQSSGTSVARANPPASQTSNTASTRHGTDFISVWRIARGGDSITLPLRKGSTVGMSLSYDFTVSWGDGTSSRVTSYDDPDKSHTYAQAGNYRVVISGTLEGWSFRHQYIQNGAQHLSSQQIISVPDLGDVGWKHLGGAFRDCANLERVIRGDVSGVVNMMNMFRDAPKVQVDVRGWDTSSVTNMSNMFANAAAAHPSMSTLDFSSVTTMQDMFNGVTLLTRDYSNFLLRVVATSTRNNVTLHGGGSRYNTAGQTARNTLVARGWSITDGGLEGTTSPPTTSPPTTPPTFAGICDRTARIQFFILAKVAKGSCSQVTAEDLRSINEFYLQRIKGRPPLTLKRGDFAGLSSLKKLNLHKYNLSSLPAGIFAGLSRLRMLWLSDSNLSSLPAGIFAGLSSLQYLELSENNLSSLPAGIFAGLSSLQYLELSENNLSSLPAGIFAGLSSLQYLGLSENNLTSLPAGIFAGLSSLQKLVLSDNNLSSLPEGIFAGLSSLQKLYLNGNNLSSFPTGMFTELSSSLQEVHLVGINITSVPRRLLSELSSLPLLRKLAFSGRYLSRLPKGMFAEFSSLKELEISNHRSPQLNHLEEGTFAGLSKLRKLSISGFAIRTFPEGIFAGLSELQGLHIDKNNLTSLPAGIFAGLSKLQVLSIYYNKLSSLPEGIFAGLSKLRKIYLSHNNLSSLPEGIFVGVSKLQTLYLSRNKLSSLPEGIFAGHSELQVLSLYYNKLSSLPEGIFAGLSKLRHLSLSTDSNSGVQLSSLNYSNILKNLSKTTTATRGYITIGEVKYNASAVAARQSLIDRSWRIKDGGLEE